MRQVDGLYEQMSRLVWKGEGGGKAAVQLLHIVHDLEELHSHDPTVSLQRSHQRLYFASGRHGRAHYPVVSVHWISSCHKLPKLDPCMD